MDWNKAKREYEEILIPDELSERVEEAICSAQLRRSPIPLRKIAGAIAACFALFIIGLNTNIAFAKTVTNIPVIGQLAKLFVFTEYSSENEERVLDVKIPKLENTGYDNLENRINSEIRMKMNEIISEAETRAKEYRKAYLETGGDPKDIWKMEITVDYEIKCSNERYVSFIIWKSESLASIYTEQYFYNIDLDTGKELTLRDLLGPNYISIANEAVLEGIEKYLEEDENAIFFGYDKDDDNLIPGFESITSDQQFYINDKGQVVVVFEKYSIAPGYMGILEFIVE